MSEGQPRVEHRDGIWASGRFQFTFERERGG